MDTATEVSLTERQSSMRLRQSSVSGDVPMARALLNDGLNPDFVDEVRLPFVWYVCKYDKPLLLWCVP